MDFWRSFCCFGWHRQQIVASKCLLNRNKHDSLDILVVPLTLIIQWWFENEFHVLHLIPKLAMKCSIKVCWNQFCAYDTVLVPVHSETHETLPRNKWSEWLLKSHKGGECFQFLWKISFFSETFLVCCVPLFMSLLIQGHSTQAACTMHQGPVLWLVVCLSCYCLSI